MPITLFEPGGQPGEKTGQNYWPNHVGRALSLQNIDSMAKSPSLTAPAIARSYLHFQSYVCPPSLPPCLLWTCLCFDAGFGPVLLLQMPCLTLAGLAHSLALLASELPALWHEISHKIPNCKMKTREHILCPTNSFSMGLWQWSLAWRMRPIASTGSAF